MSTVTDARVCVVCDAPADEPTDSNGQPWCADCYDTGEPT